MPSSRGRASRSESGPWRRVSVEDGQGEPSVSEEEAMAKPRAVSVARSTKGRRSKAEMSSDDMLFGETQRPTAGGPAGRDLIDMRVSVVQALSYAGSVLALLCLLGLLTYSAGRMKSLVTPPPPLSHEESSPSLDDLLLWIHDHMPWTQHFPEAETGMESLENIQKWEDAGSEMKATEIVCTKCPVCTNTVVCHTEPVPFAERTDDPIRIVLPPCLSKYPNLSHYTQHIFSVSYQAIQDHPWVFMLMIFGAACQTIELLLRSGKVAGAYALDAAQNIMRMHEEEDNHEIVVKLDLNAEPEEARKEAKEKLLARMRNIEPLD
jgi:hypothetical protein